MYSHYSNLLQFEKPICFTIPRGLWPYTFFLDILLLSCPNHRMTCFYLLDVQTSDWQEKIQFKNIQPKGRDRKTVFQSICSKKWYSQIGVDQAKIRQVWNNLGDPISWHNGNFAWKNIDQSRNIFLNHKGRIYTPHSGLETQDSKGGGDIPLKTQDKILRERYDFQDKNKSFQRVQGRKQIREKIWPEHLKFGMHNSDKNPIRGIYS